MNDIERQILSAVEAKPGQKAKDIATQLGLDRSVVNACLFGSLKGRVLQDKSYRWYPKDAAAEDGAKNTPPTQLNTPLGLLARYYLDCLSHDDLGGVSDFAASKYGDPNYVELDFLPMLDNDQRDPFDSEPCRHLLARVRRDRYRQTVFLGYPVRLNFIRSRKGWEGFMVEPILLFAFQDTETRYASPILTDDLPQINFKALRALTNTDESSLMQEAILLADELGLSNTANEQPDFDELLARLCEIRSDWDWKETIDPRVLTGGTRLSELNEKGIFNRAILVATERSPYTKGLESELGMLQSIEENKYGSTALGAWLASQSIDSPPADQQPLIEVLPLNSEQRQAVRQALSNQLTVITGPPGTGKSQVVTSILVNAAWQGKTVLFASKNNKAVDVVETRVNALGSRPVLLRLGANQHQGRLAEYLVSLLAATATADDYSNYHEHKDIHTRLGERSDALDAELQLLIELRNEVDLLEQQIEKTRFEVGHDAFRSLREMEFEKLKAATCTFLSAIDQANKAKQSLVPRLVWPLVCSGRYRWLSQSAGSFEAIAQLIGLPIPTEEPNSSSIVEWVEYGETLAERFSQLEMAHRYFTKLSALTKSRSLEELSRERKKITEDLTANSEALWQAWLRLQPSRLTPEQRKVLGDYITLLQIIVSANDQNRQLGGDVFRRLYRLFPKLASILSCWAVTSLAARGKVPFDPGFFDLLVVDEASQCDIASALPLLYRARRVVVIGDPMQLRHISSLSKLQDQQLLSKHGLLDDRPRWAYSVNSLFDIASSLCKSEDIVALRDHHRSHSDIIEFSNKVFYDGRLRVATNYDRLLSPHGDGPAVRWVNVQGKSVRPAAGGAVNEEEARTVVSEIERLLAQGYRGSIGVVSPFRAQANRIRELVFQREELGVRLSNANFLCDVVHSFQGDERDVVLFSPTISEFAPKGALWFLQTYPNLFNVAVTRARAALIVVGDKQAALNCGVDYFARFASYTDQLKNRPRVVDDPRPADLGLEYPRVSNPERVSEWEHLFYRALYLAGIRPIPQYSVEKYTLDFAILSGIRRLNIEIDGERYHRNWDGELCRRDQIRNQRLIELGWDVMRFWVYQVRDDLDHCLSKVRQWIER